MQKKSAFLAEWTNEMELMLKKTEKRVYRSNKKITEKQKNGANGTKMIENA